MKQKIKTTGKKMNPIVIVVIAVIAIGAIYYGVTRWRQQQYVNQLAKLYGGNAGLLGNLTGGGNNVTGLSDQFMKDIAKKAAEEEANQKKEDAKEAAKTPLDIFNETKEVSLTANISSIVNKVIEPQLTTVFGKVKPTLVSGNYMGQGDSFMVIFKLPRQPTSEDINQLVEELVKSGYVNAMSSIEADSANIIMDKDGNNISISYEGPENQEIGILYIDQQANN